MDKMNKFIGASTISVFINIVHGNSNSVCIIHMIGLVRKLKETKHLWPEDTKRKIQI